MIKNETEKYIQLDSCRHYLGKMEEKDQKLYLMPSLISL